MADDQQDEPNRIADPLPPVRGNFTDRGPSRGNVEFTVSLKDSTRPNALIQWGEQHGLSVNWRDGDAWAYVDGAAADVASALGVEIHDYHGDDGKVSYSSPDDPAIPAPLRDEVAEIGRIIGDTPLRRP